MKSKQNLLPGIFLFLFLVFLASLAMYVSQPPPNSLPASAPPAEFSAERAFRHVEALAREPRPVGTAAHARARKYIVGELQALGLSPQIQETTVADPKSAIDPKMSVAGTVQNVMARLAGTGGSKAILLVSHYDSVATGPGASDDGSGLATLLETARSLRAGPPLKNDVILLFTDGEEAGLLGARAFVEAHPWAKEVGLALIFDTGGTGGVVYTYETSPGNTWIIYEYAKAVPYPTASSMMYEVYRTMPNESDFTPLKQAGIPGFNFPHLGGKSRYHTLMDNPDHLDLRSLQHHGSYALSLTRHFGALDLSNLPRDGNLVYFGILNKGLLYYPEAWALPLAILAALLFIGLAVFGWRRGKVSLAGLLWGSLVFLLNVFVSSATVWLAWRGLVRVYPQYGAVVDLRNGFFYWLAFIILTLAVTTAFYNLFRRYLRLADLALGALLWWVIPTVVASQVMPGVSYWVQWPLGFSLIGLGFLWLLPEQEFASWRRVVLLAVAAVPALLIFSWNIYASYLALETNLIIVPVLTMALMLGLFIPHFDLFARPYRWALPATAGFVAAAALIAGSLTATPDAASPQADSIFYALNADTGQALWVSEDPQPDVWTSQFLGTTFSRRELPELFPHLSDKFLFAPAPALNLTAPQVKLLNDRSVEDTRTLHLHITTPREMPWAEVSIGSTSPISAITLEGRHIPYQNDPAQSRLNGYVKTFQYWVPPAQGFDFTVEVSPSGSVKVFVHNYGFGLPQIPGFSYDPRPADRMPLAREFFPKNKTDTVLVTKSFVFDRQK
jgi:Peptidase family M28